MTGLPEGSEVSMRWLVLSLVCVTALFLGAWGHRPAPVKIGLLLDHSRDREAFLRELNERAGDEALEWLVQDAKGDPQTQAGQARELIRQGAQALVVFPCEPSQESGLVQEARKQVIPVIALERPIPNCDLTFLIAYHPGKIGEMQAEALLKKAGKGDWVLLGEGSDAYSQEIRKGQLAALKSSLAQGDIRITASLNPGESFSEKDIKALLDSKVTGVLAANPSLAEKAVEILKSKGRLGEVRVAGRGADLPTCQRLVEGTQALTIYEPARKLAEETAYLAGKAARKAKTFDCEFFPLPNGDKPVQAVYLTPLAVNAANLESTVIKNQEQKREEVYGGLKGK
jgi:D-xylose transport system substrate-binding protein